MDRISLSLSPLSPSLPGAWCDPLEALCAFLGMEILARWDCFLGCCCRVAILLVPFRLICAQALPSQSWSWTEFSSLVLRITHDIEKVSIYMRRGFNSSWAVTNIVVFHQYRATCEAVWKPSDGCPFTQSPWNDLKAQCYQCHFFFFSSREAGEQRWRRGSAGWNWNLKEPLSWLGFP